MQIVPLNPVASQTLNITLGNQACTINVYQKGVVPIDTPLLINDVDELQTEDGYPLEATSRSYLLSTPLYVDLYVNNTLVLGGVLCRNATPIVRDAYFGFIGDLAFYDTQGATDPIYGGLGTRYILAYLSPGDIVGATIETLAA